MSFLDIGLFEELEQSTKYVPAYVQVERMKKEALEIGKRQNSIEIAKSLKRSGLADEVIAENTGLTLEEVQKLRVRKKT